MLSADNINTLKVFIVIQQNVWVTRDWLMSGQGHMMAPITFTLSRDTKLQSSLNNLLYVAIYKQMYLGLCWEASTAMSGGGGSIGLAPT